MLLNGLKTFLLTDANQLWLANASLPLFPWRQVSRRSLCWSVLSLMYINELHSNINACDRLFADDCVIYRSVMDPHDSTVLQDDLNTVSNWCDTWLMKINTHKTKAMTFTLKRHLTPHMYFIGSDGVENVSSFKYLGVHLSSDLTWNLHVEHIAKKPSRTLGFLKRTLFQANPDKKTSCLHCTFQTTTWVCINHLAPNVIKHIWPIKLNLFKTELLDL